MRPLARLPQRTCCLRRPMANHSLAPACKAYRTRQIMSCLLSKRQVIHQRRPTEDFKSLPPFAPIVVARGAEPHLPAFLAELLRSDDTSGRNDHDRDVVFRPCPTTIASFTHRRILITSTCAANRAQPLQPASIHPWVLSPLRFCATAEEMFSRRRKPHPAELPLPPLSLSSGSSSLSLYMP